MTEEEIIEKIKTYLDIENNGFSGHLEAKIVQGLLELYNKQKEEIEELNSEFAINTEIHKRDIRIKELEEVNNCLHETNIEQLADGIRVLGTNPDITTEEIIKEFTEKPITEEYMEEFKSRYISKDEVLKALGYEENDEEYKRIYNKEDLILSLIRTINEECDRLEDIEDKKVMLEEHNIENRRDKYWEDKIRERLEKLKEKEQELSDEQGYFGSSELQARIEELEELAEEV